MTTVELLDEKLLLEGAAAVEGGYMKAKGYSRLRELLDPVVVSEERLDKLARVKRVSWRVARAWLQETRDLCVEAADQAARSELAARLDDLAWAWVSEPLGEREGDLEQAFEHSVLRVRTW